MEIIEQRRDKELKGAKMKRLYRGKHRGKIKGRKPTVPGGQSEGSVEED